MPESMRAMLFDGVGAPLRPSELAIPEPAPGQLLLRVHACGVCRTDLHLLDGEVAVHNPPRVFGHQVVATVVGENRRVGVPWLGWTDGTCPQCTAGRENLCEHALFTGADIDGGYAEYMVADERFCLPIQSEAPDVEVAPLLCAGLIGYRAMRLAGEDAARIGFYGFGNAAHILTQLAVWQGREVYAFTRPGDNGGQDFAREIGATWAGGSDESPPLPLDAAIIFASVGPLVPAALRAVRPGGTVVCGGIHMTDIPAFPYDILWGERVVRSVANLTRADGHEFLELAAKAAIRPHVTTYPLEAAGEALRDLRAGSFLGAAVLVP
jgi:propanol-preferring alcohol dehydrogenase